MAGKQVSFFSTQRELVKILEDGWQTIHFNMYRAGLCDDPNVMPLSCLHDIEPFQQYILISGGGEIKYRKIEQRSGVVKYAFDQMENPKSLIINFGGILRDNHMISSQLGTSSTDDDSLKMFYAFKKMFNSNFTMVKSYYLSAISVRIIDEGGRLSATPRGSLEYDLKR